MHFPKYTPTTHTTHTHTPGAPGIKVPGKVYRPKCQGVAEGVLRQSEWAAHWGGHLAGTPVSPHLMKEASGTKSGPSSRQSPWQARCAAGMPPPAQVKRTNCDAPWGPWDAKGTRSRWSRGPLSAVPGTRWAFRKTLLSTWDAARLRALLGNSPCTTCNSGVCCKHGGLSGSSSWLQTGLCDIPLVIMWLNCHDTAFAGQSDWFRDGHVIQASQSESCLGHYRFCRENYTLVSSLVVTNMQFQSGIQKEGERRQGCTGTLYFSLHVAVNLKAL